MKSNRKHLSRLLAVMVILLIAFTLFLSPNPPLRADSLSKHEIQLDFHYFLPILVRQSSQAEWIPLGFTDQEIKDIYLDPALPGHGYAAVFFGGMFETFDDGKTWNQQPDISTRLFDIAVHPENPETMYAATWSSYGMYWTENGGSTWEGIPGWPSLSPQLYSVAVHPLTPTLMLAGSGNFEPIGGEIFKTTNGGQSWYIVSPMFTNALTFAFDPDSPTIIYAGTQLRGVYKSIDAGMTWQQAISGLPTGTNGAYEVQVSLHPDSPSIVYAATSKGLYISIDGAENWEGLWEDVDANFLVFDSQDSSKLYLGTDAGIYVSYNTGLNWFPLSQCLAGEAVKNLAINPHNPNTIWAGTDKGLWQCILN